MSDERYRFKVFFDSADSPKKKFDAVRTHTETREVGNVKELVEELDTLLFGVDNPLESGEEIFIGDAEGREYGYWGFKARGEDTKPYVWAKVKVEKLDVEPVDISSVFKDAKEKLNEVT